MYAKFFIILNFIFSIFSYLTLKTQAIKSLTSFMIYVAYNSKLEQSFILDKYADFEVKKGKSNFTITFFSFIIYLNLIK